MFAIINLTYVFSFYLLIISITNCDAGIICDARHIVGDMKYILTIYVNRRERTGNTKLTGGNTKI